MLAYFVEHDTIVNTETITYVEVVRRSDRYLKPHVIIRFTDGAFLEFPPGVSLHEVFSVLEERSSHERDQP